jgi:hypothetical protein
MPRFEIERIESGCATEARWFEIVFPGETDSAWQGTPVYLRRSRKTAMSHRRVGRYAAV